MLSLFSGLANLAGAIIEVWVVLEGGKQKQLDREHQIRIQKAQHDHELFLQRRRTTELETTLYVSNLSRAFLERLTAEAAILSSVGFEVVYEPIGEGYGLALSVSVDVTLVFWLPLSYPYRSPDVYMRTDHEIEKIEFEPDAWQTDHTIAEVVSALTLNE